jgi:predicted nucleic acid-binding protein
MVIDTSIFIDHLRAKDKHKTKLYNLSDAANLHISSVSLYELYMGATTPDKENDVKLLTEDLSILPFNDIVAVEASRIYHKLRVSNKMIEFRDVFIAATCLVNELPLLTLNHKHFSRIKGLKLI